MSVLIIKEKTIVKKIATIVDLCWLQENASVKGSGFIKLSVRHSVMSDSLQPCGL